MQQDRSKLADVAKVFLKLGLIGFGGPAVHIAMMEEEIVRRRRWLTHADFLDLIGATNLIPGPNSTEMALHCGQQRAGWKGLLLAGACFILPAVILSGILGWAYQQYGALPQVKPFIYGIKPAIIGIVISLMVILGKKAIKNAQLGFIGAVCILLALAGINEIYILFGAGFAGVAMHLVKNKAASLNFILPLTLLAGGLPRANTFQWRIFWIFLKIT